MYNEKIYNISFIKTIMMLTVIACHSLSFFTGNWAQFVTPVFENNFLGKIADFTGLFHVQAFTMASGYLFYYLKFKKNKYNNTLDDLKKRSTRLLIPYIFTSILWVIPFYIGFYGFNIKTIIKNYVFCISPSQLWFLIMLFVLFVIFEVLLYKVKISLPNLILIFFTSTLIGNILTRFNITFFKIDVAVKYITYFYLGGYLSFNQNKVKIKQILKLLITFIALFLVNYYLESTLNNKLICNIILIPLISMVAVTLIFYLFTWIVDKKIINFNNKIYKFLENNSFGMYLFHQQIIYITIILFNGRVTPILQVILSFLISSVISAIMSVLLKKNKVTKFMFGL